jgi:hypothetical protein
MIYYVTICCRDNQDGVRQFYVGRRLVFLILFIKFLQKLDKKLDSRQQSSWNCRLFFITCGVEMYMNKIAGSLCKQLMLEIGLASVSNPNALGLANTFIGLATLPAVQQWEIT